MRAWIRFFLSLLIFLISVVSALALAEFILREFYPSKSSKTYYDQDSDYRKDYFTSSDDLGGFAQPGRHSSKKLTIHGEAIYDVVYTIGEDGFRHTMNFDNQKYRINFLGCSFTFGEGLNDNETLPYFLSKRVSNVFIKSFSFHGYGPHHALAILESDRDTAGDINIFLTSAWHAERSFCIPEWSKGSPKYILDSNGQAITSGKCRNSWIADLDTGLAWSSVWSLLKKVFVLQTQDRQIQLYLAIVEKMAKTSHSRGQKFLVGYIDAGLGYFQGSYNDSVVVNHLERISDGVLDFNLKQIEGKDRDRLTLHPFDSHPSAYANELRSEVVFNALKETFR